MTADPLAVATILGMAAVTYMTRAGGYWLVRRVPLRGRLAAALEAVPGAIIVALVAPAALATGPAETAAALAALAVAVRGGPMLLAVGAGMLAALAVRALGF